MVKLIFIYPTDPCGPKIGGVETFIKGAIEYAPSDFEIQLIGITSDKLSRPPKVWKVLKIGNKTFSFFPMLFEKNENRKTLIPLSLRFAFALKYSDIQFDNSIILFNRIEPALLFKWHKIPKMAVIHSDIVEQIINKKSESTWHRFPRLYLWFEKIIFNSLYSIYIVSKNTLNFYNKNYSYQKSKFHFFPNWVDKKLFFVSEKPKRTVRKRLALTYTGIPLQSKWILFVGRLQSVKDPLKLAEVFYECYKKNTSICLIIIGEGNMKSQLLAYANEKGLRKNMFFIGSIGQSKLSLFYKASDLMLLTSKSEGMPRCVLEALSCGLPVVSTNVGEVEKVIKNSVSGELVNTFFARDIALAVEKVLENPQSYTKENCSLSVEDYSPERALHPLYEDIRNIRLNR